MCDNFYQVNIIGKWRCGELAYHTTHRHASLICTDTHLSTETELVESNDTVHTTHKYVDRGVL